MIPPTALPSGARLLRDALDEAVADQPYRDALRALFPRDCWARVVPETVFQIVTDVAGQLPWSAFAPLAEARQNRLQQFLKMHGDHVALITTNFDQLLGPTALHLHGDIGEPASLGATIRQIGAGLTEEVRADFQRSLAGSRHLVILGYSGTDRDVMLEVEATPPGKITWFVRDDADPALSNAEALADVTKVDFVIADLAEVQTHLPPVSTRHVLTGVAPPAVPFSAVWHQQAEIAAAAYQLVDAFEESLSVLEPGFQRALRAQNSMAVGAMGVLYAHALNRLGRQAECARVAAEALKVPALTPMHRFQLETECALAALDTVPPDLAEGAAALARAGAHRETLPRRHLARLEHNLGHFELVASLAEPAEEPSVEQLSKALAHFVRAAELKRCEGDLPYLESSLRDAAAVAEVLFLRCDREYRDLTNRYQRRWSQAYYAELRAELRDRSELPGAQDLYSEAAERYLDLGLDSRGMA